MVQYFRSFERMKSFTALYQKCRRVVGFVFLGRFDGLWCRACGKACCVKITVGARQKFKDAAHGCRIVPMGIINDLLHYPRAAVTFSPKIHE